MFFNAQRPFGFILTLLLPSISYSTSADPPVSYSTSQLPVWPTVCQVDALSFGLNDTTTFNGYVDINGERVISTTSQEANQGFNTLELNVTSCSASNIQYFNTYSSTNDSDNMATYIRNLPPYTVLLGVTADEASQSLNQNAKSALLDIGVDATGLVFLGKMSFVAQIGQPAMTVMQIGPKGGNNVMITVNFTVCQVDAFSFGFNDTTTFNGYVDINGKRVVSTTSQEANRGFNTLELDFTSCSASNIQRFNTYSSNIDSDSMATYIRNLPPYTVLIGVTADEASQSLTQNAKSALLDIGVNATELVFLGKMSFVAQIGQPAMTVMQIGPKGGNSEFYSVVVCSLSMMNIPAQPVKSL